MCMTRFRFSEQGKIIAPLPLRFFALGTDARLAAYVQQLNDEEQEKCRKIYAGTGSTPSEP